MSDLISRQAAIDALSFGKEMLSRVLDDTDVVGTDREKYSWGLGLIESSIKDIEELPSAQPDRMKLVQQTVNTIMSTSRSYSIRDKAFRNAARFVQCAIDGEAPDFEQIPEGDEMPSAQPEIIRCKDCKNSEHWYRDRRRCFLWSEDGVSVFDDGFCNYAERRQDD